MLHDASDYEPSKILQYFALLIHKIAVHFSLLPILRCQRNGGRRYLYSRIGLRTICRPAEAGVRRIRSVIESNTPYFIGRLGNTETRVFCQKKMVEFGLQKNISDTLRKEASINAGIFSNNDAGISEYCEALAFAMKRVTHLCLWSTEWEPYLCKMYMKDAELLDFYALRHWFYPSSWMGALRGKKVLIVSPFIATMQKQVGKLEQVFSYNSHAVPRFKSLAFVKAVQTNALEKTSFSSWGSVLDYLFAECMKHDFDVAILGCGAYGLPLGGKLFDKGKNVIVAGGFCQCYFGILGQGYNSDEYLPFVNRFWVYPDANERPKNYHLVDGGKYW